ncbi:MAG: glycosyltransferase family 2 protein [Promethearchaeota archaeon]|jgi:glycosyltransferase involved in cell wall biosynthesis
MPLFSIVITTTRPKLVGFAVQSALSQSFEDIEIIISDNSEQGCKGAIERFTDPRITYIRPSAYMGVVDHWNFAFSKASGDWQMLLCDDHAFVPSLLSILAKEIEKKIEADTMTWTHAAYYDGQWGIEEECLRFCIPQFSGSREIIPSKRVIEGMFESGTGLAGSVKREVPLITNAVYSKRIIERIKQRFGGHLFEPICPMTSAALAALAMSSNTLRIHLPLVILGTPKDSASGHIFDADTYTKMNQGVEFKHVPLQSMSIFPSIAAETALRVQRLIPDELGHLKLNWINFFVACDAAINELQSQGRDSSCEISLYNKALNRLTPEIQEKIKTTQIPETRSVFFRGIEKLNHLASRIRNTDKKKRTFRGKILDTRKHQFKTILDCANHLDCLIKKHNG